MLRSYLTLALRTLRRRLGYTAVNALGLTVGLACCALVAVFLRHELTWDAHHEDADRIHRILRERRANTYSTIAFEDFNGATAAQQRALAERLPKAIPAIEQATNFEILSGDPLFVTTEDGSRYRSDRQLVTNTGPALADVFTFERLAGAPLGEALSKLGSAVLTQSTAQKYFGDQNPIGKTVTVGSTTATVRAMIADPPPNSRIRFDLALQLKRIPNYGAYHYVRLAEGADPDAVASQVTQVMNEVRPKRVNDPDTRRQLKGERLQALTDIHLSGRALYDDTPHRNPVYLWVFGIIAALILLITTVNYANLGLALYADRNEEIGVRKAVGGYRSQIAGQFLTEAALLSLACAPLALGLCASVLPAFNALVGTEIAAAQLVQPSILGATTGLALLTGLLAGGYPAFVMARRRAIDLFGRGLSGGGSGRRGWSLRHVLIGLQFAVLIGLGSLSWVAYDQLRFMQGGELSYETEGIVDLTNLQADSSAYVQLKRRLLASPAVRAVGSGPAPSSTSYGLEAKAAGSSTIYEDFYVEYVDTDWFKAMGIEHPVVKGMRRAGPSAPERVLLNRAAVERLGFEDPIGREVIQEPGGYEDGEGLRHTIAGVMANLHLRPMRQKVKPTIFRVRPSLDDNAIVRFASGRTEEGMDHVGEVWSEVQPDVPLETSFFSNQVAQLYEQERQFMVLAGALAGLAILMAAIGLGALVTYLTRLRRREIGVRKALGASVGSIVVLFNREYVQVIGVAFAVGAPLAWVVAGWWLGRFAYRVDLSVWPFLAAGVGALVVAVGAVSVQTLRAARVNPARMLRSE